MLSFKAEDGYSYLINIKGEKRPDKCYRIDSEEVKINLGTNETLEIKRLDISPEISSKLGGIRKKLSDI